MNTEPYQPDPVRVMIVVDIARCSIDRAERTIEELDKHDAQQQATTPTETPTSSETGGGYTSFTDMLPVGKAALVAAGYGAEEAGRILTQLFTGLAAEYGGKRLYLPKADKIMQRIQKSTQA